MKSFELPAVNASSADATELPLNSELSLRNKWDALGDESAATGLNTNRVKPDPSFKRHRYHQRSSRRPLRARWALRGMLLFVALLVLWASLAEVGQVTRASGQIVTTARTQLVQSADGGIITSLHVNEGDIVKSGQLLVTLQKERAEAAVADTRAKVAALRITLSRLQAEVYGTPLMFEPDLLAFKQYISNQTALYKKRQTAFKDDEAALIRMLRLAEDELAINRKLEESRDVSRADILRLERSVVDISAQLASKRNKYFQDAQAEMTKAQEELSTQTEQLRDRIQLLEHTELLSPMDAIVNNIKVNTIGGVVRGGDTVMELLPTGDNLVAEAKIATSDIAFISMGQEASIKLDAYDSSIFGSMSGNVTYISPDVLTEETRQGPSSFYKVRVSILGTEFKGSLSSEILLRPGMTASIEIKARDRTVLSYLTKPITKTFDNALGER